MMKKLVVASIIALAFVAPATAVVPYDVYAGMSDKTADYLMGQLYLNAISGSLY